MKTTVLGGKRLYKELDYREAMLGVSKYVRGFTGLIALNLVHTKFLCSITDFLALVLSSCKDVTTLDYSSLLRSSRKVMISTMNSCKSFLIPSNSSVIVWR